MLKSGENIKPMDMKRILLLTVTDIKLVLRTTRLYAYLPPVTVFAVLIGWRFGKQLIHLYMAVLITIFSMIFSTQFTRIDREMFTYSVFPFPLQELIAAKNLSSLLCVAGLTILSLLISAVMLGIDRYSIVNSSALILFISLVFVSSGNIISVKSAAADISYNLFIQHFVQALAAAPALAIYIILEGRIGLSLTAVFCFIIAAVMYMVLFLRTRKILSEVCMYLLE